MCIISHFYLYSVFVSSFSFTSGYHQLTLNNNLTFICSELA